MNIQIILTIGFLHFKISSIVHTSSSLNKQLSLLSENLLTEKIISINIFLFLRVFNSCPNKRVQMVNQKI
ncbi:hypothetical protein A4I49_004482 [Salmonella enterica subsp. enterica serovar Choleraesuis]|nr:hypothetical protein [Salmonella enterica subsp. enterica]EBY0109867.1 hypothetical protein [Salmonella enterica subsp. enterica serovar Bahati]EDQ7331029.1 hypothetical protein [Salmonella enterica subsp. enterica serovar Paratyphi C]EEJ2325073.1 hypothetical protein [Salmonella enterica subsp. enterica serovar Choleraesuis]EEJ3321985.1 hypothetical protein [Salmonella enterica subsp. enterica serovar Paratyphi C]